MLFRTRDGTFKDPETIVLLNAIEHFSRMSWDDKGISIHGIKDIMVEGWMKGVVKFLSTEEWEKMAKEIEAEKKKADSYVV